MKSFKNHYLDLFLIFTVALLTGFFSTRDTSEIATSVLVQHFQSKVQQSSEVVILAIDDESYQDLGASFFYGFPTRLITEALRKLEPLKPKLVILDAPFPELVQPGEEATFEREVDEFVKELKRLPSVVWSGVTPSESNETLSSPVTGSMPALVIGAAKATAPMLIEKKTGSFYWANEKQRAALFSAFNQIPGLNLSADAYGKHIIDTRSYNNIPSVSIKSLLENKDETTVSKLKDKVVLIGLQSEYRKRGYAGSYRFFVSGQRYLLFGVDLHAILADNIIAGTLIKTPSTTGTFAITAILALFVAVSALRRKTAFISTSLAFLVIGYFVCWLGVSYSYNFCAALIGIVIGAFLASIAHAISSNFYTFKCQLVVKGIVAQKEFEKLELERSVEPIGA